MRKLGFIILMLLLPLLSMAAEKDTTVVIYKCQYCGKTTTSEKVVVKKETKATVKVTEQVKKIPKPQRPVTFRIGVTCCLAALVIFLLQAWGLLSDNLLPHSLITVGILLVTGIVFTSVDGNFNNITATIGNGFPLSLCYSIVCILTALLVSWTWINWELHKEEIFIKYPRLRRWCIVVICVLLVCGWCIVILTDKV